ncbi:mCG1050982 [Mus musculus]|nr:mCG1050982 [Mus musculus]
MRDVVCANTTHLLLLNHLIPVLTYLELQVFFSLLTFSSLQEGLAETSLKLLSDIWQSEN